MVCFGIQNPEPPFVPVEALPWILTPTEEDVCCKQQAEGGGRQERGGARHRKPCKGESGEAEVCEEVMAENERFDPDGHFLDDDDNCAERRGSDDNASFYHITAIP